MLNICLSNQDYQTTYWHAHKIPTFRQSWTSLVETIFHPIENSHISLHRQQMQH
jgi:hypothetical protein